MAKKIKAPEGYVDIPLKPITPNLEENELTDKMVEWFRKTKKENNNDPEIAIKISLEYFRQHNKAAWI